MTSHSDSALEIHARIAQLELRTRRLSQLLATAMLALALLVVSAFRQPQAIADRLDLRSPNGSAEAQLRVADNGSVSLVVGHQVVGRAADSTVRFRSPIRGAALIMHGNREPTIELRQVDGAKVLTLP